LLASWEGRREAGFARNEIHRPRRRIMKVRTAMIAMALLALAVAGASAQERTNLRERIQDRRELRQDRRKLVDDTSDLIRIKALRAEFRAARSSHNEKALAEIDARVLAYLRSEIGESRLESLQAGAEVRRGRLELDSDRREIERNQVLGAPPRVRRDDRRDLRDDRRDLRDDLRDAARERRSRRRLVRIRKEWKALAGRYGAVSLERRAQLLDELVRMAAREGVEDRRELREDRRELREDRRESREDRRQP